VGPCAPVSLQISLRGRCAEALSARVQSRIAESFSLKAGRVEGSSAPRSGLNCCYQVIALSPLDVAASVAWHGNRERTGR
jgi:hypothetical protein